MNQSHIKEAAKAMSALYVWDCVVGILEGGASPSHAGSSEYKDAQRVIKIANAAKLRLLKAYDRVVARSAKKE